MYQRTGLFAREQPHEIAFGVHIEDFDRHSVLLAEREGGQVHHFQTAAVHLVERDRIELHGRRVFLGVGRVDTVDTGSLEQDVGFALAGALAVSTLSGCGSKAASDTWKFGGIGPITGSYAQYGLGCKNAIQIAVDEINEAGGINGVKIVI